MAVAFSYAVATNTVTVTGGTSSVPADFAQFVTADRAGAGTSLLAAWAPNSNTKALTYQVRPVELLALLISFVVASKTAETDYIFITGTDAWGTAQTESIDVSAGNGTYASTKRFQTITNIDCSDSATGGGTVWANGTVAVTQPIWGVIWNKGNWQYQISCKLIAGDGSTATYFADTNKLIVISKNAVTGSYQYMFTSATNAVMRFGTLINLDKKITSNGCSFLFMEDTYYSNRFFIASAGEVYLYSCTLNSPYSNGNGSIQEVSSGKVTIWNSNIMGYNFLYTIANGSIYRVTGSNASLLVNSCSCTMEFLISLGQQYCCECYLSTISTIKSLYGRGATITSLYCYQISALNYLVDADLDSWTITWGGTNTGSVLRQYTLNLHLTDTLGSNISGATVTLKDATDATVFSTITDANGDITFSGEDSSTISNTVSHTRYYYSGGAQTTYYGPWTLTITKTGYQTYQDVITIDRQMDLEIALNVPSGSGHKFSNIPSCKPVTIIT